MRASNNGAESEDLSRELYYYGARYYDAKLKIFTQVDPLWDKYPGWGSYVYCLNNPLLYVDPNGDSVEVGTIDIPIVPDDDHIVHTILILTDEETGEVTVLEGMPETRNQGILVFLLQASMKNYSGLVKGTGWGNLIKQHKTKAEKLSGDQRETVAAPEGMSDAEFRTGLSEAYDSYDNSLQYAPIPAGGTANSNSLTGGVLRAVGSSYIPRNTPTGWNVNVLPSQHKVPKE